MNRRTEFEPELLSLTNNNWSIPTRNTHRSTYMTGRRHFHCPVDVLTTDFPRVDVSGIKSQGSKQKLLPHREVYAYHINGCLGSWGCGVMGSAAGLSNHSPIDYSDYTCHEPHTKFEVSLGQTRSQGRRGETVLHLSLGTVNMSG